MWCCEATGLPRTRRRPGLEPGPNTHRIRLAKTGAKIRSTGRPVAGSRSSGRRLDVTIHHGDSQVVLQLGGPTRGSRGWIRPIGLWLTSFPCLRTMTRRSPSSAPRFALCEDTPLGGGKRWVVVRSCPSGANWRPDRGAGLTGLSERLQNGRAMHHICGPIPLLEPGLRALQYFKPVGCPVHFEHHLRERYCAAQTPC